MADAAGAAGGAGRTRRARPLALAPLAAVTPAPVVDRPPSILDPAGPNAEALANLWWIMLGVTGVAIAITVAFGAVAFLRRRRETEPAGTGRRPIVLGGVVLPLAVAFALMIFTATTASQVGITGGGHGAEETLAEEAEIEVIGHQFWWEVRYPGAGVVTANEIHIPAGRPVRLRLEAADVIHSVWVPELNGKMDMTPGHVTFLELEADEPGIYRGQCAEYCGVQHALMAFLVIAEEPADYEAWLAREGGPAAEPETEAQEEGAQVFLDAGCGACHTIRGTEADGDLGPDLTHFGSRLSIGALAVENTRGNLGGWIVDSQSLKPGNLMPPMRVESQDLQRLLDYLEALE